MLIALLAVTILVTIPIVGGDLSTLSRLRLRQAWLVAAALAVQIIIISVLANPPPALSRTLHIATYLTVAVFLILNRRIPYLWLVAVGGAANLVVIAANNGVMPASAAALRTAGRTISTGFNNSTTVNHPHLSYLGDIFATPKQLPLANVFSLGDIIILTGLTLLVATVSRTPAINATDLGPQADPDHS